MIHLLIWRHLLSQHRCCGWLWCLYFSYIVIIERRLINEQWFLGEIFYSEILILGDIGRIKWLLYLLLYVLLVKIKILLHQRKVWIHNHSLRLCILLLSRLLELINICIVISIMAYLYCQIIHHKVHTRFISLIRLIKSLSLFACYIVRIANLTILCIGCLIGRIIWRAIGRRKLLVKRTHW